MNYITEENREPESYLSDLSELSVLAANGMKIAIYVGRDADGKISNRMIKARTKQRKQKREIIGFGSQITDEESYLQDIHSTLLKGIISESP